MDHKYRKKPVVIEAFQMTKERCWDTSEWPDWMHKAWNEDVVLFPARDSNKDNLEIQTLEGVHLVSWGDWIIQGVKGEIYPCKPDIFELTYEPAKKATSAVPLDRTPSHA